MNSKTYTKFIVTAVLTSLLCFSACPIVANEGAAVEAHDINFKEVPVTEFIRFVSKISQVNFIFDNRDLQFNVSFSSGKSITSENVLQALIQVLRIHGFGVMKEKDYHVIHKLGEKGQTANVYLDEKSELANEVPVKEEKQQFSVFKLQYHQGAEIQEAIKKIALDLKGQSSNGAKLMDAIQSMQWVKTTNSLLCSGDAETLVQLKSLISSLDIPLRQVFIEVLVIETDVRKGLDFGLQWGAGGKYKNHIGGGIGHFANTPGGNSFSNTMQGVNASNGPTGLGQIPVGSGFDLGVIGDIILHKGTSFITLGALVHALQADTDSTIVLNQKIITQDNKNSKIFVGDNIPFPGSVVQTVGNGQQTTSNIEYRDIGVSLSITPMLGEGDIITLDIDEEISEALNTPNFSRNNTVNGIRSTKTNMVTHVHVPDKHFLVLSGMVRNHKSHHREGIPWLGKIPFIGSLFSRKMKDDEKRNVIIFVRPHIVHSFEEFKSITQNQEETFKSQANAEDFDAGVNLVK